MPRLPPTLLRHARVESPLLVSLLPTCRDLDSARNELRWLREHVEAQSRGGFGNRHTLAEDGGALVSRQRLKSLCRLRGRGVPLQYLLGTEHFGELEIECRPGVLIPRSVKSRIPSSEQWLTSMTDRKQLIWSSSSLAV